MDIGEIIQKSWVVYKQNFPTLVIPFLTLAIAISAIFSFIGAGSVSFHLENNTIIIAGENLSSPDLLDNNDENYFEVRADENHRLEVVHDSRAIPEIHDRWIQVCLSFASSIPATYHLDIYDFFENSWENGELEEVGIEKENWVIERITDIENYLSDENSIRVRVITENAEVICREDSLVYQVIRPPEFKDTIIGYLAFLLGLTFCCGIAINTTRQKMLKKKRAKLGDILKITGRNYLKMLVAAFMVAIPLVGFLYLFLSYPWGMFLILPAFLLIFFCVYIWQGIVIRSLSPWGSVWNSFKVTRGNIGTTFVLCLLFVLVWFFLEPIPVVGTVIVWLFLPLWFVALSVTYMDRTEELPEKELQRQVSDEVDK
ncbi:hypothetical protein ES706_00361 [subsurface metagenome]|nr:hypothetical protein [Hadesarchaea archaeon]